MRAAVAGLIGPVVIVILWYILIGINILNPTIIPAPHSVAEEIAQMVTSQRFWTDVISTIARYVIGFTLASFIGIMLGILFGARGGLYSAFRVVLELLRSTPAMAFFPAFMVIFGIGEMSKIGIAVLVGALIILFNTVQGFGSINQERMRNLRLLGANKAYLLREVYLYELAPHIFTGLRLNASLCLIAIVVTEMFAGTETGIGYRILESSYLMRNETMYAYILASGMIGLTVNTIFGAMKRRIIHWA